MPISPADNETVLPAAREIAATLWQRGRRVAAVLGIIVVLLLGVVAYAAFQTRTELLGRLDRSVALQTALKDAELIRAHVLDLESGQRGYLLTGERSYLRPFDDAPAQIEAALTRLAPLTDRWPDLRLPLTAMRDTVAIKRGELASSLSTYENDGPAVALQLLRTDLGRHVMRDLDEAVREMQRLVRAHLAREQGGLRETIAARGTVTMVAVFAALAACLVTMVLLSRHFVSLRNEAAADARAERSQRESREKSFFLANMSHEIRTPMNAIFGFAQLLSERVRDPLDRQYVDSILTSGRSLLGVINDILDLSKIEAGKLEVHPAPTSLRETVDSVLTVFGQLAQEKGLQLSAQVSDRVPDAVLLDGGRVRQMLFNLVGNAIKYTERGEVRIAVGAENAPAEGHCALHFEVSDTGIGIAADDLARIFDPFEQGANARQREGTGLGLSITRRLASLMGGTITARSEPGQGSTFRVDLPDVPITVIVPRTTLARGRLRDLPPMTVLIVDDVALNRQLLCGMLGDSRHHVLLAEGGADALAIARERTVDLVLVDIRMPGMDGFEAAKRLRTLPGVARAVFVAITASSLKDEEDDLAEGFDGYLRKPISQNALFGEITRLLPKLAQRRSVRHDASAATRAAWAPPSDGAAGKAMIELLQVRAPALRRAMAMREIESFAQELGLRASAAGADEVLATSRELAFAVQAFDVPRTERLLDQLASLAPIAEAAEEKGPE